MTQNHSNCTVSLFFHHVLLVCSVRMTTLILLFHVYQFYIRHLNLALNNYVEHSVKHAELSLRGPYLIDREMCIMVYCPFCNAYLKLVLTDDPLDFQRVVFPRGGGDEG